MFYTAKRNTFCRCLLSEQNTQLINFLSTLLKVWRFWGNICFSPIIYNHAACRISLHTLVWGHFPSSICIYEENEHNLSYDNFKSHFYQWKWMWSCSFLLPNEELQLDFFHFYMLISFLLKSSEKAQALVCSRQTASAHMRQLVIPFLCHPLFSH